MTENLVGEPISTSIVTGKPIGGIVKSSYNPQEEIADLTRRVEELEKLLTDRLVLLEEAVRVITDSLKKIQHLIDATKTKTEIKLSNIEGTLGREFKRLSDITRPLNKWTKK